MSHDTGAYGLWALVAVNSAVFIIFAFSFGKPQSPRDWRSFSAFSAFIVALFSEMYGFPLTIYLLSGWLQTRYPGTDLVSHDAGHLWSTIFGWQGNSPFLDERVRQAVSMSIDRDLYIDTFHNVAKLGAGLRPLRLPQHDDRREAQEPEAKAQGEEGKRRRVLQADLRGDVARAPHRHEIPGEESGRKRGQSNFSVTPVSGKLL